MELDVVLAHKLILFYFLVLPPVAPVVCLVCGDADIPDRGVKPHIEHFVFKPRDWNGRAPFEITRDAPFLQANF